MRIVWGIFIVLLLFVSPLDAVELKPSPTRECAICHFRWLEPFYYEERGTLLHPLQIEKVAGTEMMCFSCHDGSTEDSRVKVWLRDRHKVNIRPSNKVRIPRIFPLSQDGKIVCSTCHSAHGVPTDTSIERVIFLRVSNKDSIMCEMCHVEQTKRQFNHPLKVDSNGTIPEVLLEAGAVLAETNPRKVICETCHTAHGGVEKNFVLRVSDSSLCSSCHREKRMETGVRRKTRRNHPLMVQFREADMAEKLYSRPNGTVQCSSCHKVHQPEQERKPYKLLAVQVNESTLCIYCHGKKVEKGANHPIGVALRTEQTRSHNMRLFLGPQDTLQCLTCHGVHMKRPRPYILVATQDQLCAGCHESEALVRGTDHDFAVTALEEHNKLGETIGDGGVCSPCHVAHNGTPPYLWARKIPDKKRVTPSDLCLECHKNGGLASKKVVGTITHPVKVEMRSPPKGLPLFATFRGKGQVECGTCHDPHKWWPGASRPGTGKNEEGGPLTSFLRRPMIPGAALCGECHPDKASIAETDHDLRLTAPSEKNCLGDDVKGGGVCSPCHIVHNAIGPYLWARNLKERLSHPSDLCQNCHKEGGVAGKKPVGVNSHPVKIAMRDKPVGLPLFKVSDSEPNLECGTCHDPHKWWPGSTDKGPGKTDIEGTEADSFLRKSNFTRPDLCNTCHPQQGNVTGTDHDLRITAPQYLNLNGEAVRDGSPCRACHGIHNAREKALLWVAPLGKGQDFIEMSCYGCHSEGGPATGKTVEVGSHPQKLYFGYYKKYLQLVSLKGVPLFTNDGNRSLKGEITCATCHDPHIWDDSHPSQVPGRNVDGTLENSFLYKRLDLAQGYCSICHGPSALFLFRFYHDKALRQDLHKHDGVPLIQILR